MGSLSQHGEGPVVTGAKESEATGTTREGFSTQALEDELTEDKRSLAAADVRLLGLMRE